MNKTLRLGWSLTLRVEKRKQAGAAYGVGGLSSYRGDGYAAQTLRGAWCQVPVFRSRAVSASADVYPGERHYTFPVFLLCSGQAVSRHA